MAKRTMVIDGSYMLKRILREYSFTIDCDSDRNGYLTDLSQHLACEIQRVSEFVDNIIICRDSRSWRKGVPVKHSITIDIDGNINTNEDKNIQYKANRVLSDDRNWEMIYSTFNDFCECLNRYFDVSFIYVDGAEGDDAIYVLTKYLRSQKIKSCVYCTDSDLNQLVTPSNVILRRIKSKAAPEGEIVVHPKFWELYNKSSISDDPLNAFSYNITAHSPDIEMFKGKSIGNGIVVTNPYFNVFKQMFMGSGKDNVPGLFSWKAKTTNRYISNTHIQKAIEISKIDTNEINHDTLYNEPLLKSFIINLCIVTKQHILIPYLDNLYDILCTNRKMNYLSSTEIPENVEHDILESYLRQNSKADIVKLSDSKNIIEKLNIVNNKLYQELGITL